MKIGVVRTSLKENERRIPIYPEHLPRISPEIRKRLIFESGYGRDYGFPDSYFVEHGSTLCSREELFGICDLMVLVKPVQQDLDQMREGQYFWGWPHCVQQTFITQAAIDKKMTLIAWEGMYQWNRWGERVLYVFYRNREIAGYAAILHLFEIFGIDGFYGPRRNVAIIGYGSVSRGAIYALHGRGFHNIHVYTRRPVHLVADKNPNVYYHHLVVESDGSLWAENEDGSRVEFIEELSKADIICNGVLQDTDNPLIFVNDSQVSQLKPRSAIVDISCDEGMGFSFARPTTFENPTFTVGDNITYYSVDHTPSYLWNASSRELSKALLSYLPVIVSGPDAWEKDETISKAIEIREGVIQNSKILSFQNRDPQYPHMML